MISFGQQPPLRLVTWLMMCRDRSFAGIVAGPKPVPLHRRKSQTVYLPSPGSCHWQPASDAEALSIDTINKHCRHTGLLNSTCIHKETNIVTMGKSRKRSCTSKGSKKKHKVSTSAGAEDEENANEVLEQDCSIQLCYKCNQIEAGASYSSQCRLCCLCFSDCMTEHRRLDVSGRD
jgi:hypothetical protein